MADLNHIVIRQESYVAGTRERPEVGVFTQTHASRPPVPWDKLSAGDLVCMKWSGGPSASLIGVSVSNLRFPECATGCLLRTATLRPNPSFIRLDLQDQGIGI